MRWAKTGTTTRTTFVRSQGSEIGRSSFLNHWPIASGSPDRNIPGGVVLSATPAGGVFDLK
jgi:hypothetical protein